MTDFHYKDGINFSVQKEKVSYPAAANDEYFGFEDKSFWFQHRNLIIAEVLKKYQDRKCQVIDLGGGNGFVAQKIKSMGYPVTLVEAGGGVYNAKRRGIDNLYCVNLLDYQSSESEVCVGLFDVVEHFSNSQVLFSKISENIPGASILMMTVPAYKWLWSEEDDIAGHFTRYTKTRLKDELNRNGYEILFCSYFFSLLILPIALFRSFPYQLKKAFDKKIGARLLSTESAHVGFFQKIIRAMLKWEIWCISRGIAIPFGGSIVVIAKKKKV
ncbi:methyltransferase domain-containing protein [Bdellovibrio svalbardensis]|uniref:Class I SAM-dependent methyltransferase n=1 Tax=Bdellovibrio svalbardensis TaxID=2972972 RepID=A0ABT6DN42_9BACT|nr:hypothetical protein [Bdellovibrio svalbardensis]MDG0817339.1 class I SAM-dependent methyltransferase [Bdellovibrio svalbardensis]